MKPPKELFPSGTRATVSRIRMASTYTLSALLLAAASCAPARPIVICVVENPATHERATMYKEDPFKVPRDYDETRHIAQWKAERAKQGFTVEVTPRSK